MTRAGRHSWSEGQRYERHTDRCCWHCGLIKRTRHEGGQHWIEFHRDGVRVPGKATPPCPGPKNHLSLDLTPTSNPGADHASDY